MLQLLEDADLTDGRARDALVLCLKTDFLERNHFACKAIPRLVHYTIRPLSNLLDLLILLHSGSPGLPRVNAALSEPAQRSDRVP